MTSFYPLSYAIVGKQQFSENDMEIVQNVEIVLLADSISNVFSSVLMEFNKVIDTIAKSHHVN